MHSFSEYLREFSDLRSENWLTNRELVCPQIVQVRQSLQNSA